MQRSRPPRRAKKAAATLTGDAKQAAADNPQCKLFTPAEAAQYIGEPVSPGRNAGMGYACQWVASDGSSSGSVMVTVVPARYHQNPKLGKGYRPLAEFGAKAYVVPQLGGWAAGALDGKEAIEVWVTGLNASEASAVALLKESLKRHRS
jgi:hypothetical protein